MKRSAHLYQPDACQDCSLAERYMLEEELLELRADLEPRRLEAIYPDMLIRSAARRNARARIAELAEELGLDPETELRTLPR